MSEGATETPVIFDLVFNRKMAVERKMGTATVSPFWGFTSFWFLMN